MAIEFDQAIAVRAGLEARREQPGRYTGAGAYDLAKATHTPDGRQIVDIEDMIAGGFRGVQISKEGFSPME